MSVNFSRPLFSIGDKVMIKRTSQVGRISGVDGGVRRVDDKYLILGEWYSSSEFTFIK